MAKHKFVGRIHSVKDGRLFVLFNDGDYFGATVWPSRSQLQQLNVSASGAGCEGVTICVEGNIRQTMGHNGSYMTAVTVPKGEHIRIAVLTEDGWVELKADESAGSYEHELPF